MPVFNKDAETSPDEIEMVTVRVTERGHGKISTGKHDGRYGEEFFADGDEYQTTRENAEELANSKGENPRMYVTIVKKPVAKA